MLNLKQLILLTNFGYKKNIMKGKRTSIEFEKH
jgi:hypothetical protein